MKKKRGLEDESLDVPVASTAATGSGEIEEKSKLIRRRYHGRGGILNRGTGTNKIFYNE